MSMVCGYVRSAKSMRSALVTCFSSFFFHLFYLGSVGKSAAEEHGVERKGVREVELMRIGAE
jgi:hypothetical protein